MSAAVELPPSNPFRKIRVFVSSKCGDGGRFDNMRRQLAERIESTGIFDAFLFERGGASTETATNRYLTEMRDCDVVVFVIDNKTGVTPGVSNEIELARQLDMRALYYFVSEFSREHTTLERELAGSGPRYKEVEKMDLVPHQVLRDLLEDMLYLYRKWCNHGVVDDEGYVPGMENAVKKGMILGLPRSGYMQLPGLQEMFRSFLLRIRIEQEPLPGLDAEVTKLARSFYIDLDVCSFDHNELLSVVKPLLPEEYGDVIELRWEAIRIYLNGNDDQAIKRLKKALIISDDRGLTQWFVDDILVDLRNMLAASGGAAAAQNEYQKRLSASPHEIVYPLIDREVLEAFKEIDRERFKTTTNLYDTITYGEGVMHSLLPLCRAFAVAACFGSLTHLSLGVSRMKSLVLYLCGKHRDSVLNASLLKLAIVDEGRPIEEKTRQAFNDMKFDSDSSLAMEVFEFCRDYRSISKNETAGVEGFAAVGYYLDDLDYTVASAWFVQEAEQLLAHADNRNDVPASIFHALSTNAGRLTGAWVLDYCARSLDKRIFYWRQAALAFISRTAMLENYGAGGHRRLLESLNQIVDDACGSANAGALCDALIALRATARDDQKVEIDRIAQKMTGEYLDDYLGSVGGAEGTEKLLELARDAIDSIIAANQSQGKHGGYFESWNYHCRASYIITRIGDSSADMAKSAFIACLGTLMSPEYDCGGKVNACEAMCELLKSYNLTALDPHEEVRRALLDKGILLQGRSLGKESMSLLEVWLDVLLILCGESGEGLFTSLSRCYQLDVFNQAAAGDALRHLFDRDASLVTGELGGFIFSYACFLVRSMHFQLNLRGLRLLSEFVRVIPFRSSAARALIDSYDGQSPRGKCIVIDCLRDIEVFDRGAAEELRDKVTRDATEPATRYYRQRERRASPSMASNEG